MENSEKTDDPLTPTYKRLNFDLEIDLVCYHISVKVVLLYSKHNWKRKF